MQQPTQVHQVGKSTQPNSLYEVCQLGLVENHAPLFIVPVDEQDAQGVGGCHRLHESTAPEPFGTAPDANNALVDSDAIWYAERMP